MTIVRAVIHDRRIEVPAPEDLPDGTEVILTIGTETAEDKMAAIDFMSEDEQSDDPEVVEQWIDDLQSIPPVPENSEKEAEWRVWDEKIRQFNIEAVRKHFEEGMP